jgi:hypothetical protein
MYHLREGDDLYAKISSLARKVETMELRKDNEIKSVQKEEVCSICEVSGHTTRECPTIPTFKKVLHEQANVINTYKKPFNSSYSETYNPGWRNHPNFSWRQENNAPPPPQEPSNFVPYLPPHKRTLEDTLQTFMQGQDTFNSRTSQAIDDIKSTLTKITSFMSIQEKGKFPSQPERNPRYGVNEVQNTQVKHAKSVTILRSGNEVNKEISTKFSEPKENLETKDDDMSSKVDDVKERLYKPVARSPKGCLHLKWGQQIKMSWKCSNR